MEPALLAGIFICVATVQWLSCNCERSRRDQLVLAGFTKLVMEIIWNSMPALWSWIQLVHMIVGTTGIISVQICMRNRMVCGRKLDFFEMLQLDDGERLAKESLCGAVNFWAWHDETVYWTSTMISLVFCGKSIRGRENIISCGLVCPHDLWIVLFLCVCGHLRNEDR